MEQKKDNTPEEISQNFFDHLTKNKDFIHYIENVLHYWKFPEPLIGEIIINTISGKLLCRQDSEMLKLFLWDEKVKQHIEQWLQMIKMSWIEKYSIQMRRLKASTKQKAIEQINWENFVAWLNIKRINSRISVILADFEDPEDDRNDFYTYRWQDCTTYIHEENKEIIVDNWKVKNSYLLDKIINTHDRQWKVAYALVNYDNDTQWLISLEDGNAVSFEKMCLVIHGKFPACNHIQKKDWNELKEYIITQDTWEKIWYITRWLKETSWKPSASVFNFSGEPLGFF